VQYGILHISQEERYASTKDLFRPYGKSAETFCVGVYDLRSFVPYAASPVCHFERFSLLAIVPLALYNGNRGKWKLKYLFYIYYPLHLAVLHLLQLLLTR